MPAWTSTLCVALVSSFVCLSAHAQPFRAYVASYGDDANPCTVVAPCRLLPAALSAVADGGEIWILDSANFNQGTVSIGKSVSILSLPGQLGSIVAVRNGPAITIQAADVKVGLRNVLIGSNVTAPGSAGIEITGGAMLSVEDSFFQDLPGDGIWAAGTTAMINVRNCVFRNLGGYAITARDGPTVTLANSQVFASSGAQAWGVLDANATTTLTVTDSTISGRGTGTNASTGVFAGSTTGNVKVAVTRSTIDNHAIGLLCSWYTGTVILTTSFSTITGNATGVEQMGSQAVCASLGNNHISGNRFDIIGNLSSVPLR